MKIQQDATMYQNFISCLYENPNFIFIWKFNKMHQCIKILFHIYMKIQISYLYENPTRCNNVSRFYYPVFIWSLTCFGRHTAHHQVPKTALETSGFACVEGWWTCRWWTLSGTVPVPDNVHQLHIHQPSTHAKPFQVFLSYFPECQNFGTIQKYAANIAFTSFEHRTVKPAASRYTDYLAITLLISSLN